MKTLKRAHVYFITCCSLQPVYKVEIFLLHLLLHLLLFTRCRFPSNNESSVRATALGESTFSRPSQSLGNCLLSKTTPVKNQCCSVLTRQRQQRIFDNEACLDQFLDTFQFFALGSSPMKALRRF